MINFDYQSELIKSARDRLSRYIFSVNWVHNVLDIPANLKHFIKSHYTEGMINIMPLSENEKKSWREYQSGVSKSVDEMDDKEIMEFINAKEAMIFQHKAEQAYAQTVVANRYQKNKKATEALFSDSDNLKSPVSYRAEKAAEKKAAKAPKVNIFGDADMAEIMKKLKDSKKDK